MYLPFHWLLCSVSLLISLPPSKTWPKDPPKLNFPHFSRDYALLRELRAIIGTPILLLDLSGPSLTLWSLKHRKAFNWQELEFPELRSIFLALMEGFLKGKHFLSANSSAFGFRRPALSFQKLSDWL